MFVKFLINRCRVLQNIKVGVDKGVYILIIFTFQKYV